MQGCQYWVSFHLPFFFLFRFWVVHLFSNIWGLEQDRILMLRENTGFKLTVHFLSTWQTWASCKQQSVVLNQFCARLAPSISKKCTREVISLKERFCLFRDPIFDLKHQNIWSMWHLCHIFLASSSNRLSWAIIPGNETQLGSIPLGNCQEAVSSCPGDASSWRLCVLQLANAPEGRSGEK